MMLKVLREGGIHTPSLRDIESYDAVLVLGEDITRPARAWPWRYARQ
ncbi:NADH-ubiquinone oxidoreductase subunit G [Klebsiella pneumoniae]|uniref:NADH-ubiquinone oxidoreductase subunit G n=1 Tax=Klebsiella pneumoniae TaxID=573 RepID=A0A2X3EZL6_KLEPN|nr:NADH-ubiquinone oxidoreductase subunit G [Klebsiella pneumoniae]